MTDTECSQDATIRKMLESLMNKMVTVHGFSPEEARHIVKGELLRAYDERTKSRHFSAKADEK
jgi:hypothetical protein